MFKKVKRTTHCKYMHPLSGDNLHVSSSGKRTCIACRRAYKAAYRLKKGYIPRDPTRCRKGHPFDAENTVIKKSGQRRCRICMEAAALLYNVNRDYTQENERRRKTGGIAATHQNIGAIAERSAIVAWLRSQGGHHDDIYEEIANDIEQSKHHEAPSK